MDNYIEAATMAFEDFDLVSNQRNEEKQKLRKKILVGVVSSILLVCVVGAAAIAIVKRSGPDNNTKQVLEL